MWLVLLGIAQNDFPTLYTAIRNAVIVNITGVSPIACQTEVEAVAAEASTVDEPEVRLPDE